MLAALSVCLAFGQRASLVTTYVHEQQYRLVRTTGPSHSAEQCAQALGAPLVAVVKSLVFVPRGLQPPKTSSAAPNKQKATVGAPAAAGENGGVVAPAKTTAKAGRGGKNRARERGRKGGATEAKSPAVEGAGPSSSGVLVLAQGGATVCKLALSRQLGGDWRLATPDEAFALTGHAVGTIPPFGTLPTLADEQILDRDRVFCGAGDCNLHFEISPSELLMATGAIIGAFSTAALDARRPAQLDPEQVTPNRDTVGEPDHAEETYSSGELDPAAENGLARANGAGNVELRLGSWYDSAGAGVASLAPAAASVSNKVSAAVSSTPESAGSIPGSSGSIPGPTEPGALLVSAHASFVEPGAVNSRFINGNVLLPLVRVVSCRKQVRRKINNIIYMQLYR